MNSPESDSEREDRFDEIVANYLEAIELGDKPDQAALIVAHPEFAESLQAFFLDHDQMAGMLNPSSSPSATDKITDQPTLPYLPISPPISDQSTLGYDDVVPEGAPARRLGDYLLLDKIAQGGMGVVFKAQQISLNRIVALKMIRAGDLADGEEVRRFRAEAEAAAQLDHPGIVPIYQVGAERGHHYFSMALVEGQSLAQMSRQAPLPPRVAASYVMRVAEAVQYAHERGIIHRDLKPANVLVDQNDEPKVTDFGLAKRIKADDNLTLSGQILGTASYMPPEQASGQADRITVRSDVYSLGAVLYNLLTQQAPFSGENPLDIILDVLSKEPTPPRKLNPRIPIDLETICLKCLDKDPAKRYASAAALAEELDRFLVGKPIQARPIGKVEWVLRWCKRKPLAAATIALCGIILVGSASGFWGIGSLLGGWEYTQWAKRWKELIWESDVNPVDTVTDLESLLISTAQKHYSTRQVVCPTLADEARYSAGLAMLYFDQVDGDDSSATRFVETAALLERLIAQSPDNVGYQSALADCLMQIYKSVDSKLAHVHVTRASDLLQELVHQFPSNEQLVARANRANTVRTMLTPSDTSSAAEQLRKLDSEVPKFHKRIDQRNGIVRFEFDDVGEEVPTTSTMISVDELAALRSQAESREPHALLRFAQALQARGEWEEASVNYKAAFSVFELAPGKDTRDLQGHMAEGYVQFAELLMQQKPPQSTEALDHLLKGIQLQGKLLVAEEDDARPEFRRSFRSLAVFCANWQPTLIKSIPDEIWPDDPRAVYDAVLELRSVPVGHFRRK